MSYVPASPNSENAKITVRVAEAARITSLSRTTLYELMRAGKLASRKVAGCRVIPVEELRRLMTGA